MNVLDIITNALEGAGATEIEIERGYSGFPETLSFNYEDEHYYLTSEDMTAGAYDTAFIGTGITYS